MTSISQLVEEMEFELMGTGRFNSSEPIYGEENRRQIKTFKRSLHTKLTKLLQSYAGELEEIKRELWREMDEPSNSAEEKDIAEHKAETITLALTLLQTKYMK